MAFCLLCRHGQSRSPPAGGETTLRKEPSSSPMRASGPTKKRSIIAPSSAPFGGTYPYPLCRFATSPPDRGSRPPDPITGVTPWTLCGPSGAQYQECLGAIPSGPTGGLSGKKIGTGAVLFLRLPLPNQRSRPPGRAVLLTDRRPQYRAARTCINPGIEGGPVCCPCGNRATSQDTPSPRAELEPHQPQRRAFHR